VLIAGAGGVVGSAAITEFTASGWKVTAVSRRKPEAIGPDSFEHISLDLQDRSASGEALRRLSSVSHLVFAALSEKPGLVEGWSDTAQMEINLRMFQNCVDPFLQQNTLEHVALMQGTKAYGLHLHPMEIPARESSARDPHPNFYWLQEDYLKDKSREHGFRYTVFRPPMIVGSAYGAAMNLIPVLGAFAAISKETGIPFGFPGGAPFVWEALDSRLLARAFVWAATSAKAGREIFNITNGDVFAWRSLWPALAGMFGVTPAPDSPLELKYFLPSQTAVWDSVVRKHSLKKIPLMELLGESHHCADFVFAYGASVSPTPAFMSTIKLRQAGFCEVMDTEETFKFWAENFISRNIIPGS
jgi:nucleoside-diphosphate-sugar epimerase